MNKFKAILLASRPKTLPASAGPVILGASLALKEEVSFSILVFALTLFCALLLQVSTNLVNDYYDGIRGIDSDDRLGPKRVTSEGLLSPLEVKKAFLLTLSAALVIGITLMFKGGLPIIVIGLSSIFFAWAYTGGPLPLSYFGLGEILAIVFFGPVPVWGTFWLLTGTHSNEVLIFGLAPGFLSGTLMAINNLRDRESDSKTKKKTIAVLAGEQKAKSLVISLTLFSILVPGYLVRFDKYQVTLLSIIVPLIYLFKLVKKLNDPIDETLNQTLATTGKTLFLYCIAISATLYFT